MRMIACLAAMAISIGACSTSTPPSSVTVDQQAMATLGETIAAGKLRPVASFSAISDTSQRSAAIFMEMGKVLTHPRCVNCHPRTDIPLQGDAQVKHSPPVTRGADGHGPAGMQCATCHGPKNAVMADGKTSVPGNPKWALAPIEMAWEGKSIGEICEQIRDRSRNGGKSFADLHHHNAEDILVGYGWEPGPGRQPAPGTQKEFGELTQAWINTGAVCPKPE